MGRPTRNMSRDEAKATESLAALFAKVDVNANGKLEYNELTRVFGDFADQFLEFCDQDKDKEITVEEWTAAIIKDTADLSEEDFQAQWVTRMTESLAAAPPAAPAKTSIPKTSLSSGPSIPMVGLGTWKSTNESEVSDAIKWALEAGYTHFDCAACYQNEHVVGAALGEALAAGTQRGDIFVTGKLWNSEHDPANVKAAVQASIRDLQCEYLDLFLIHWPQNWEHVEAGAPLPHMSFSKNEDGSMKYTDVPLADTWKALEECVDEGLLKSIGLSNFNEEQIKHISDTARIQPAMLQVEIHPFMQQEPLVQFAKAAGLAVTAYSPLGSGAEINGLRVIDHPDLIAIGAKHSKSAAQVVSAWLVARGIVVIPKSVKQSRIQENFDVIFELDAEDMATIAAINGDLRAGWGGPLVDRDGKMEARDVSHPQYPFK